MARLIPAPRARGRSRVLTGLALVLLIGLPLAPGVIASSNPIELLRLPAESIVALVVVALLPWRAARVGVGLVFGLFVGVAMLAAAINYGYESVLDIPFDPTNANQLNDAFGVLKSSVGGGEAYAVLAGLVVIALGIVAATCWAVLRVAALVRAHVVLSRRALAAAAAVWLISFVVGVPIAASASFGAIASTANQALVTRRAVAKLPQEIAQDQYAASDPDQLLSALKGKDVVLAFVESYGQVAVQGTSFSPGVDKVLQKGQAQLTAEGYSAQSAWLTSPTFGGLSWLAHSTLESGLWIDRQPIYSSVVRSKQFTLSDAFAAAGWNTVSDVPSDAGAWSFGTSFYHFGTLLNAKNVGYQGPSFGYARIPDEYTWKYFTDHYLTGPHQPVMAEIDLVSSHTPWAPLPTIVPWSQVGDGSIYGPQPAQGHSASSVWRTAAGVQQAYGQSIQYSLNSMFSFLANVNDPNLVVIELGDHQPATIVSGKGANHEVPISIISKDPSVFKDISGWHWQTGIKPTSAAPLWRMDAFRNRFFDAFENRLH